MFGNRSRLKLIIITALVLALAFFIGAGAAEGIQALAESQAAETSYNLQQADPRLTYRSGGDKVDSIDGANSLTLLFFAGADNPLPQDADTVMYYDLPRNVAAGDLKDLETDTVSLEYDEQLNRLYFRWKNAGGGNAFSVTLPVTKRQPFYTVNHVLRLEDGNEKVYLSETKPFISGMLIREAPIEIEGYEGENAPYETEKRSDYEDVVTFYYHRIELHYQLEYLAIDGTILRPRSIHSGYYGDLIEPPEEVNGYRFVYCDQGETPIPLTQDNQYISLRYSTGNAGWMPADQGNQVPADLSYTSDYIVRHVIPAEFTYGGQDVVLKTSAGKAGNPVLEQYELFDGKYYCDQSRTEITDTGVTFYYRPVQLSVQLNYVEGYMGANGPERTDPKAPALKEAKTLALWYGQDYNLNGDVERQFIANGVEYTFIGTDNVNKDLMYHGTEDNRVYNLYYIPSVTQSGQATYQVTWKNWDGVVLETDQGVVAGESPSYNSITPIRPADEASMYEFAGWNPTPSAVSGNAEYTAVFNPIPRQYGVRFVDDSGNEIKLENLPYGTMPAAEAPEKEGTAEFTFRFAGWEPELAPVTGDATYKAVYDQERKAYTVRFTDEEGNELSATPYYYGTQPADITQPAMPEKEPSVEFTYTFSHWDPTIAEVTGDATYKAVFAENKRTYQVTWTDENGKVLDAQTLEYGAEPQHDAVAKPETKENVFTFAGWDPEPAPVKEDVTYKAVFETEKKKYPITWRDESGRDIETTEVEYGAVPSHEPPEKEPTERNIYEFKAWQPRLREVTGPAAYKATYETKPREYTVRFLTEDGEEISSASYRYGTQKGRINVPGAPEKAATEQSVYEFAGWDPAVADVKADADYTAVYTESQRTYRIVWQDDTGAVLGSMDLAWGEKPEVPAPEKAPTDEYSYDFAGWEPEMTEVAGEAVYTATFTEKPREYIVRFVDENGEAISSVGYRLGTPAEEITLPETPVKPETPEYTYTFAGWIPEIAPVSGDAAYQASFAAAKRQYTIRFTDENGETLTETTCEYGTPASAVPGPAVPAKEATEEFSYTFAGWDPAVADVTGDAVYKAVFTPVRNQYQITWLWDDGSTMDVTSAEYGSVPVHADPVKPDTAEYAYTFTGWTPEIAPVTGNAAYQAVYEAEKRVYTLRFTDEDGKELSTGVYPYGTAADEIEQPEVPGKEPTPRYVFNFTGWKPELAEVTRDMTYQAVYVRADREYTVRFLDDDGSEISSAAYPYDTPARKIAVPDAPVKEATETAEYTFTGWNRRIANVREDADYTALYREDRIYTVRFVDEDGTEISSAKYKANTPANQVSMPESPVKEATETAIYTFTGWEPAVAAVTGDAEYRAVYTATKRQYTVRFVDEDGRPLAEDAVYEYGTPAEAVRVPADPQKERTAEYSYAFAGWDPAVQDVTGDAVYKAAFGATKNRYLVTWIPDNGTEPETQELEYGAEPAHDPVAREATPEYTYTFTGWEPEIAPVTGDVAYRAVYTAQKQSYTVRFLDGTGEEIVSASYEYATAPEAMQVPEPQQTILTDDSVYTFARWQPAIEPVTGDATYQAAYSVQPRPYVLHFLDADGNELAAVEYPYGTTADAIQAPQAPAIEPTAEEVTTFTGWEPALAQVTGEATYRVVYATQPRPYTVRFLGDGGTVIAEAVYPYGTEAEKILLPETVPEKAATAEYSYTFIGWEPGLETVTGNRDYQAVFDAEKNKVKIHWENEDGSEIDTTEVEYGEMPEHAPAQMEATPEFAYSFKAWKPGIKPAKEEATYRAIFDKAQRHYTVRFLDADGNPLTENTYRYGVKARNLKIPKTPEKAADAQYFYTFAGWEPELSDVTESVDYRPTYTETLRQYQVRFVNDDGQPVSAASYDYGTAAADVAIPDKPEKAPTPEYAYTFIGWEPVIEDVTGDAEYRAVYEAEKRSYTVRFLGADGEELAREAYEYGTPADGIEIPEGKAPETTAEYSYAFAGWQPAVEAVTGDAEYRAVYTAQKRSYTVRFTDEDGEALAEDAQYEYGTPAEAITGPAIPQKESTAEFSYVFAGWDPAVEDVTGDATYKATFEAVKNRYLVTWVPDNGAEPETAEMEYGALPEHGPVAKEATAEYTYTFAGWDPEIAPVAGDVTYRAVYNAEKNTYLITWRDEDGTDLGIVEMEYGAEPVHSVEDKDPTDEFIYAFVGWQPEVKPVTGDAVYTAVYEKTRRSYTVTWLDAAGEPMERQTLEYGAAPAHEGPAKEETEAEAYAFTGWDPEIAPVTGDAVYTPVYRTIRKITVKGADESFEYDGKPHSSNNAVLAAGEMAEGDTLVAETAGSVIEADQPCANTVDPKSVRVLRGEEDVSEEYRVSLEPGQLTVVPRKLVITTASAEKPYDGTPLAGGTDVGIEGLAEGESIAVQANGTITEIGSAENGFTIDWKKTRAANYEVVSRPGTLTVTENPAEILLTAGSAAKVYDGTELSENSVTAAGLPAGFTVQAQVAGGQTDVGTGANTIENWWILNADGEDRTACFTGVKTAEGTLEVTPRTLTVTTQDAMKEYDGLPLTAGTVTVQGLAEGENVAAAATGSLTEVGMAENAFEITWNGAAEANYLVEAHCGTLTVVPTTREIVLTTGSATATYNGRPLRKGQIIAKGLPEGFRVKGTVTGSQTQAGSSPNTMSDDYRILDADGEDRTEYFGNVRVEYGTLTVKPRRLTITTGSAEKEYDGDPIWNEEISVEGLVKGESVTVRTNGSQTEKGSSLNTYLILWDNAKAANYIIQEKLGRLTVK